MNIQSLAFKDDFILVKFKPSSLSETVVSIKTPNLSNCNLSQIESWIIKAFGLTSLTNLYYVNLLRISISEYKTSQGTELQAKCKLSFYGVSGDELIMETSFIRDSEFFLMIYELEKQINNFINSITSQLSLFPDNNIIQLEVDIANK